MDELELIRRSKEDGTPENILMKELSEEHSLSIENDFDQLARLMIVEIVNTLDDEYDDSMDGDHESAFNSIGWGCDEAYNDGEML